MDSAGPIVEGLVAEDTDEEELVVLVPARRCPFAMGGATSWHAFSSWEVTVGGSPPSLSTLLVGVFLSPLEVLEGPPPEAEEALEAVAAGVVCEKPRLRTQQQLGRTRPERSELRLRCPIPTGAEFATQAGRVILRGGVLWEVSKDLGSGWTRVADAPLAGNPASWACRHVYLGLSKILLPLSFQSQCGAKAQTPSAAHPSKSEGEQGPGLRLYPSQACSHGWSPVCLGATPYLREAFPISFALLILWSQRGVEAL